MTFHHPGFTQSSPVHSSVAASASLTFAENLKVAAANFLSSYVDFMPELRIS
ncbi:hypothetical protein PCANC_07550 [Puccinia coronata f. sp. avenae]|uniref:Uncharacterized protein n=1 Tax=Puccinia coronata f. sp. avenae TaxID=200324 RepID=A0A2N5VSL3_9BASI|nr:hypothetical protein PCANC_15671 [Puccinia coronata f. sp. avenae]PLW52952.1 hypothetical protein PCANC_07550 [Puccinia coronata f. sp. avenae]